MHTIALDREGAMWIGTQDGAARYDGRTWTVVNMPNRLNSNFVRTIRATQDGSVYFGTQSGGLARLRDGEWAMYGEGPGTLPSARVNALIETTGKNGGSALWIATYGGGLARIEGNRFTVWTKREGLPSLRVWGLAGIPDRHGNPVVWVGTESGLARLASGAGRFEIEHAFDGISVNQILSVPGPGGPTLWVGTYGKGIARSTPTGWQFLTTSQGMPSDYLTSLQASRDEAGNPVVFAGTDGGGLARITQSGIDVLSNSAGLPSQAIYSLFETRPESGGQALWIGTRNGGLVRLREGAWRTFHPPVDSPTMAVNAITAISSPTGSPILAFGTDGGGLATLSGTTWDVLSTRNRRLPVDTVLSLLASSDSSGRPVLWVGTRNGGLARVRGSSTEVFSRATGHLPSDIVLDLVESTDNSGRRILWAATRGGLVRFDGTQWSTIDTRSGLPSNSVYGVVTTRAADGQDVIWAATLGGLARLAGGHWQHFGTESGLLSVAVQALCPATLPDGRPALWVGTEGGGLSCLELDTDPPRVTTLTDETEPRLPNNTVSKIMVDRDRRLWVTTNRGVARLTPRPGGGARSFDVMTYTVADGLPSSQCTHAAGMVDESGRIWVGTVNGAAAFDPRGEVLDHAAKPLRLAASIRDGTVVLPGSSLSHNQNHVLFEAALMSLYREQDTRYRTQLVGVEHEPSR